MIKHDATKIADAVTAATATYAELLHSRSLQDIETMYTEILDASEDVAQLFQIGANSVKAMSAEGKAAAQHILRMAKLAMDVYHCWTSGKTRGVVKPMQQITTYADLVEKVRDLIEE